MTSRHNRFFVASILTRVRIVWRFDTRAKPLGRDGTSLVSEVGGTVPSGHRDRLLRAEDSVGWTVRSVDTDRGHPRP